MARPGPVSTDFMVLCGGTPQEKTFGGLIAREFGLSPQVGRILFNRGIETLEQAQKYLTPRLEELPSPESMKGMREAVACIVSACTKREPLYIHGDYDLDGISATALLVSFFREIGQQAFYYIPNRLKEKYGPSIESIDRLLAQDGKKGGGGVLITVDCGISALEEVAYAREKGLRVVVTDHHEPPPVLPVADAVVNPKQPGCTFSHATLSGVGIAFFLVMALRKAMGVQMNLKKFLDLVALGTVADVVPLQGVNRLLVRAGLEVLSATHRLGIVSLCEHGGIGGRPNIRAEDISFKLAPRINAAGRLGCPSVGVELLLTDSRDEAGRIAADLDRMNTRRRQLESEALARANAACIEQVRAGKAGLAVYQPECHVGVLGIVAARLAEIHHRPVIALTDDGQMGKGQAVLKGSGRSVKGINLFNILEKCSAAIEQFGGHAMAVGLSVKEENLQLFSSLFDLQIKQDINLFCNAPQRMVDLSLTAATDLTVHLARSLQWMQPFGEGNPEPVLALTGQSLRGMKNRNGHLLFKVQGEGQSFPGIGFHLGELSRHDGRPATLIFQLKQTWFRGAETNQVQALDIIPF